MAGLTALVALAGTGQGMAEPRIMGEPTRGCIAGAVSLPLEGEGFTVMHLERKRYYGHPLLIDTVMALGRTVRQGGGHLRVGDLSRVTGGPMPFGHRSHQTGLDVDLWFDLDGSSGLHLDPLRSSVSATSLLNPAKTGLDTRLWHDRHVQVLRTAALQPGVDRIFVNPHIKKALCQGQRGDRGWLHRIRPWHGHDDHFHLRLACPENSPECVRQASVPAGDGCDASLDWWFQPHPPETGTPGLAPKPALPAACMALLKQ